MRSIWRLSRSSSESTRRWCRVYRQQAKAIERVTVKLAYRNIQIFWIDYDTQKPFWQRFGATMQSMLIGFRGNAETGRIAHETGDAKVSAVIRGALA